MTAPLTEEALAELERICDECNGARMAASYNALPALLRELRELRAANAGMRKALKPFADIADDFGDLSEDDLITYSNEPEGWDEEDMEGMETFNYLRVADLRRAKTACEDAGKGAE